MTTTNILLIALGVIVIVCIFSDDILGFLQSLSDMSAGGISRSSHSSVSEPSKTEDSSEDEEPDDDDLRIARNERMALRLNPFDRVLVRDDEMDEWMPQFFSHYDDSDDDYPFYCTDGQHYYECIPYAGNEDLYLDNEDYEYPETSVCSTDDSE